MHLNHLKKKKRLLIEIFENEKSLFAKKFEIKIINFFFLKIFEHILQLTDGFLFESFFSQFL